MGGTQCFGAFSIVASLEFRISDGMRGFTPPGDRARSGYFMGAVELRGVDPPET
ncbi:MAG: hypothetical protein AAFY60_13125 [Myxococcota bacterium]